MVTSGSQNAAPRRVGGPEGPPETADVETSSDAYAARFAGPAGEWMLRVQERILLGWAAAHPGAAVLDVGGGHGQAALPLSRCGHRVTVLGSAPACARRIRGEVDAGRIAFAVGDLVALPYPDRAFDLVIALRLLPHCGRWRTLIAELCRAARQCVIVDYPTVQSVNVLTPALFKAKQRLEGDTRPYAFFRHAAIEAEFGRHGFARAARRPQFLLPMVLHRALKRPGLSAFLEGLGRGAGLTRLLGSPVLLKMSRRAG